MSQYTGLITMLVLFAAMYFMLIRPQKKQQQEHQTMVNNLAVGDQIITIGGLKGVVTKVKDTEVRVRVASGVEVDFVKSAIARVEAREEDKE